MCPEAEEGSVGRALTAPATVEVRTRDNMCRGRPRATIYGGYTMMVQIINSESISEALCGFPESLLDLELFPRTWMKVQGRSACMC